MKRLIVLILLIIVSSAMGLPSRNYFPPLWFLDVTGPASSYTGSTKGYDANWTDGFGNPSSAPTASSYNWVATNGTVTSQSAGSCAVQWNTAGAGKIELHYYSPGKYYYDYVDVSVYASPVATTATSITANSFTANWNSVLGATSYRLDVSTSSSFSSFVTGYNNTIVNGTSQSVTNLSAGVQHYYRVRAVGGPGTSGYSNVISVYTAPPAPTANSVSALTTSSFTSNWSAATGATSYRLDVALTGSFLQFVSGYQDLTVNETSQSVSGLGAGKTYYVRVRAVNGSGTSANSNSVEVLTIPPPPNASAAGNISTVSFTANWNSAASATGYWLDVSPNSSFSEFVSGYNNSFVGGTSQSVTNLAPGTMYYYRVRAQNSSGTSSNSNTISVITVPPFPIANPATSITTSSFTASWSNVSGAAFYRLDVSTSDSFSSFVTGYNDLSTGGITSLSVTGLAAGTTYYFRARAVNGSGNSANSNSVPVLTLPSAPVATSAGSLTTSSFTANWNPVVSATGYKLDVSTNSSFSSFVDGYNNLSVVGTSISVTGLSSGMIYYYRVRAVNSTGESTNSDVITATTILSAPDALPATMHTTTSFTVNWSSVSNADSYRLDVSAQSNFSSYVNEYNNLSVMGTSKAVTGLSEGTTYYYRVRAVGSGGTSANSNTITTVTVPAAPSSGVATNKTSDSFKANWNSVTGATGYRLDVSETSNFSSYASGYNNLPVSGTSETVTGLSPSTTYYYRVRAINGSGTSGNYIPPPVITHVLNFDRNFIRTVVLLKESIDTEFQLESAPATDKQVMYQFFNGLGRPSQAVAVRQSPNHQDIVQPIAYDAFGREAVKHLPFVSGNDGSYKTNFLPKEHANYTTGSNAQYEFYQSVPKVATDTKPYSEIIFEPSPLNRVLKQGAPGEAWQPNGTHAYASIDHTVKFAYEFNTADEVLLWTYTPPAAGNLFGKVSARTASTPVYYAANQLYKNKTKDEEHHEVIEYSDKQGKLILKKVQADESGTWAQTYYIYDDFGNQVCVMPPEGTQSALASLEDAVVNFTSNGTWTCPEGVTSVTVECWGGGGAGGAVGGTPAAGGGGAGGAYARKVVAVTPGITYTVTVGAAKTSGNKTVTDNTGNPSWFGSASLVYAQGGPGAAGGQDEDNFNGIGAMGSSAFSIGDVVYAGGNGADGASVSGAGGGAGGGAAGPSANGGNATGATAGVGAPGNPLTGNGGDGPANNQAGKAGIQYGGGGSGGKANNTTDRSGGAGAAGHVRISFDATPVAVNNWVFRSAYDHRRRKIINQVPGAQPVYIVYDNRDRVVLTQDGNQRTANRWTFTKYDALNRPVLTGIYTSAPGIDQDFMQAIVNNYYANLDGSKAWYETFTGNASDVHGYDNKSFPQVANQNDYLTVTYYDNYNFKTLLTDSEKYSFKNDELDGQNTSNFNRIVGQVTGMKAKVLNGGVTGYTWLASVNYFDDRYRVIQTVSDNYKNGKDRITNVYDFVGKVLKTKTTHVANDLHWKDLTGIQLLGDKLTRTATGSTWNTSGAASSETLAASTDGWFEFVPVATNKVLAAGFSTANTDNNWATIKYCFYINSNATFQVRENGSSTNLLGSAQAYSAGDIFRIERKQGQMLYYKNGVLLLTRTAVSDALMADVVLNTSAGEVTGFRSSFGAFAEHVTTRRMTYDHAGRPLRTYHKINDQPEVILSESIYNELGELVTKKLHSTDNGNNFKQHVDYRYNIRGWMTRINDSALTPDDVNEPKDYFGMNLAYNDVFTSINNTPQFNGNISAMKWSTSQGLGFNDEELEIFEPTERSYKFGYDVMNRLVTSTHGEKTTGWNTVAAYQENLLYDLQGNTTSLTRKGKGGHDMDLLSYVYNGNQVMRITDSGDKTEGFIDGDNSNDDYLYDNNGNMVWDRNKGGMELLTNENFESGSTNWTITDTGSRLTFADNEIQIIAGSASAVLMQNVLTKSKPYVVVIDVERTAGTLTVYLGGATSNITSTGRHVLSVTAGSSTTEFRLTAGTTFTGKIKSVSVKGVAVLAYNYLNLPEIITKAGDKQLQIIYDAAGNKLSQELSWNGTVEKRIDYGVFIYKNDTLQFIQHEEGRIVPEADNSYTYDYTLRDHLGNTRITFTTKPKTETFTATMEDDAFEEEQNNFNNYQRLTNDLLDHTDAGTAYDKALVLNGGYNGQVGLAKSFAVVPGDTIRAKVYAKYLSGTGGTGNLANFALALTGAFGLNSTMTGEAGTMYETLNSFGSIIAGGGRDDEESAPKGFINILVFNKEFELVDFAYQQIDAASIQSGEVKAPHELLNVESIIRQAGYAYVFLSNEGATEVQIGFDDYEVTHAHNAVIQQDEYYSYGAPLATSYFVEGSLENKWKYANKEHIGDLDLGYIDFGRRWDDVWGRPGFISIDRFAEKYYSLSPYQYAANNPVLFIDVNGDSINVAEQHREEFSKALTGVFGDRTSNFGYTKSGNLVYNGDTKGLSKDQKNLLKGLNKVMGEETITNIVFGSSTEITMKDGTKQTVNAADGGGAVTVLVGENNVTQNTILVDPTNSNVNSELKNVFTVTDAYYLQPIDPKNGTRFQQQNIKNNTTGAIFHEMGHVLERGNTQDKVIDYENNARRKMGLPVRPYDETHNRTVKKGQYGN